jgi:hypothetical protein
MEPVSGAVRQLSQSPVICSNLEAVIINLPENCNEVFFLNEFFKLFCTSYLQRKRKKNSRLINTFFLGTLFVLLRRFLEGILNLLKYFFNFVNWKCSSVLTSQQNHSNESYIKFMEHTIQYFWYNIVPQYVGCWILTNSSLWAKYCNHNQLIRWLKSILLPAQRIYKLKKSLFK